MMPRHLRLRLVLLATVPAFCLLLVILTTTTFARLDEQVSQNESSARQMTSQLAASIDYAIISNQPGLLDTSLRRLMNQPGVVAIRVLDQAGKSWLIRGDFAGWAHSGGHVQRFSAPIERARPVPDPDDWLSAESEQGGGEIIGEVQLLFDSDSLWRRELALFFQLVLIGVSALIFIGIMAWLVVTRIGREFSGAQVDEAGERRELPQDLELRWLEEQDRQQAWGKWSHDIRTPLHGVSGMLELLAGTELDAEQQDYLGQARAAARAMEDSLRSSPLPPAATGVLGDARALARAESKWRGKRVLLIEDDLISQHLLRGILEPWGVMLVCAGSGEEALKLRRQPWDLVMVDGELPDMNAATLAQAWMAAAGEDAMLQHMPPLVAITAHSDPARISSYRAAGLDPVLNKPLRRSHLLSVLTPLIASGG